ncbi:MAG: DUF177 domain-containing protein [Bryobacteraceae bacterium]
MFLSIREMEQRKLVFDETFPPGEVEFLDSKLRQVSPLRATGSAALVSASLGEVRIQGRLSVEMEADCDRCLEPARFPIQADFDLYYEPMAHIARAEEVEIGAREAEVGFYEGDGLELKEILRERVLLALPMQQVCRQDCKGICPVCGQNRNQQDCGCQPKPVDDRWAALKQI